MERPATHSYATAPPRLIGGAPCVDFVNTLGWRGDPRDPRERLTSYQELLHWCEAAAVLSPYACHELAAEARARPARAAALLARAIALREALARLFVRPEVPPAADLALLNRELEAAPARVRLVRTVRGLDWEPATAAEPLARPLSLLARDGAELLVSGRAARVRACADRRCAWLFLDQSRGRRRRWCAMDDCGNRAKARRHYTRRKART